MLAWMIYVILVSLLLGLAALAFERSARLRQKNTRWLWGVSIVASLILPFTISSVSLQIPRLTSIVDSETSAKIVVLRQMTARELSPSDWLTASTGRVAASPGLDGLFEGAWSVASVVLAAAVVASSLQLSWRRRRWERGRVAGVPVYISEDSGPAIVGLLDPQIVVPRWLLNADPADQELVIAHEDAHLEARDAQLLMIALCLLICMPWNLPLWWQLRRLRFAIEIDCDARVLRRGHEVHRYGEVLIAVGERQSTDISAVAAMSESKSFLEQRIRHMLHKRTKWTLAAAMALVGLGGTLVAVAAEVSPPNVDHAGAARQEVSVDAATLDGYAGFYKFTDNAVLTVTRDGNQLLIRLTGQQTVPVYAEDKTDFFAKAVNAQITFITDAKGEATSLVLHQAGHDIPMQRVDAATAQQIASRTDEKVKSQSASSGTEAALRRLVDSIISGSPNYNEMSPMLAEATRKQLPKLEAFVARLGAVKSVKFLGVGPQGEDVYTVWQENGPSHWRIALDSNGTISTAMVTPGP
jgi:bla regulator protein blaR1